MPAFRVALLFLLAACAHPVVPGTKLVRLGDEIVICGQLFHTGTRVILWSDHGGYDAYRIWPRFAGGEGQPNQQDQHQGRARYGRERGNLPPEVQSRVARDGWSLDDLRQVVRMFVLHYDAAGTSRQCFKVLQDVRGLSVHFMLDVDGTIYQTLDVKERAWHAAGANDVSVGIEIAHIGAFASPDDGSLKSWYRVDASGPRLQFPPWLSEPGVQTSGFVARPARRELVSRPIHGTTYHQYDFTDEQYAALARLTAALAHVLPGIKLTFPQEASGQVRPSVLSEAELAAFGGVVGHWHLTTDKIDPGPAFDWQRLIDDARKF